MTNRNYTPWLVLLLVSGSVLATLTSNSVQIAEARTEELLDTANNNLKISMQAPDDWNSGKLSATILSLDWKLNGIFAINFGTKLFASSEESIAFFAIVNAPSLANAAIPLAQKFGLISFALSQFVTINKESDVTLTDGSSGHLYSISVSTEQLHHLNAPIDKGFDGVLITTKQQEGTYIVIYATQQGRLGEFEGMLQNILSSVRFGAVGLSDGSYSGESAEPSVSSEPYCNPVSNATIVPSLPPKFNDSYLYRNPGNLTDSCVDADGNRIYHYTDPIGNISEYYTKQVGNLTYYYYRDSSGMMIGGPLAVEASSSASQTPQENTILSDSDLGLKISHPKDWLVSPGYYTSLSPRQSTNTLSIYQAPHTI